MSKELKTVVGDLIKAATSGEVDVIAHQCNCFNNMGKGIAPLIAKTFPQARIVDDLTIRGNPLKLGDVSLADCNGVLVFNLYGQFGWWKLPNGQINTNYEALKKSLEKMRTYLKNIKPDAKIGLPKIGCGLGGGDWSIVEGIIKEVLSDFDVTIYVLE